MHKFWLNDSEAFHKFEELIVVSLPLFINLEQTIQIKVLKQFWL